MDSVGSCGFAAGCFCLALAGGVVFLFQVVLFSSLLQSSWAVFAGELAIYLALEYSLFFASKLALFASPSLLPSLTSIFLSPFPAISE